MADIDFIEEIRIAQYWRKQLGEYEYVHHNPDDLRRWFVALETQGPEEVRRHLIERTGRHPRGMMTGVVATAPHPPLSIVELWLASRETVGTAPYWTALALFTLVCIFGATSLHGCMGLRSVDRLATRPPQMSQPLQSGGSGLAGPPSTLPNPGPPPAAVASPPATGAHH